MKNVLIILLAFCLPAALQAQRPVPTPQQLMWHEQEMYFFLHFGPNTFTGLEWGHGNEKTELFNPKQLDTDQWCRIAKAAGARGMIITAKHHDGFCLWPSAQSTHTVRESPWMNGKGDVLRMLRNSCDKYGLLFGVYISPWDRNHPLYGTPAYNQVYAETLKEIINNYGPIWEMWWDGANGEGPNGKKQVYDFRLFERTVRSLSPQTVIFSDIGPDIRWVGNEQGYAGTTNWNMLDTDGFLRGLGAPPSDTLLTGNRYGKHWIPAEVDVSIRPGWFYRPSENDKVKSAETLFDIYLKSVGRGANLLLNVPPDDRGLIHAADSAALMQFAQLRHRLESFRTLPGKLWYEGHLLGPDLVRPLPIKTTNTALELQLDTTALIKAISIYEDLRSGQHTAAFRLQLLNKKQRVVYEVSGTTIGHRRILSIPGIKANTIRLIIQDQLGTTTIRGMWAHHW